MSHELRTPLNSILILGQQLAENADGNLTERQTEFARTIHGAGTDLLNLISDILDLSKIESGTVTVESEEIPFAQLRDTIERTFRHEAEARELAFTTDFAPSIGRAITTDPKRLLQVVKNLVSNALKFTASGAVKLRVGVATEGWAADHPILSKAQSVVAFAVNDTGIGIPPEKQKIIFEAFQQADAGTARKYGGTGLGLAISRELAQLLGGEIRLQSVPGVGSTFTLYLPLNYMGLSLDVFLPDMLGWTVLSELKRDPATRHIPVQIVTIEEERQYGLERGAFAYLAKPLTTDGLENALDRLKTFAVPRVRELLVVEDDPGEQMSVVELLSHDDVRISTAGTGAEALNYLRTRSFDCVVLDLKLPDMTGFELLTQIQNDESLRDTPIVVFTGRELTGEEEVELRQKAKSIVLKGAHSPERLLDETALFLHRAVASLPPAKQRMLESLHDTDEALAGKKALVVDDDVRNIFALSSLLERHGMSVVSATTGQEAIDHLEARTDLELVLMDIMMPEMDGYETMQRIRRDARYRRLPIIALTAKAMKGDREKCLEAGASDYIAKPVNTNQLLSLVRMWLHP
jgi:CheY-like chemotaxis protein